MKPYKLGRGSGRRWGKISLFLLLAVVTAAVGGYIGVKRIYEHNLQPVNPNSTEQVTFTVSSGESSAQIGEELEEKQLIRSSRAFKQYVRNNELGQNFIAGTYKLSQSMSVQDITKVLTEGDVAEDLFTIYPGNNLDQIKRLFLDNTHYSEAEIDKALDRSQYNDHPVVAEIPAGKSLEGFLYPDSYQFVAGTTPQTIISQSLDEMGEALTAEIRQGFTNQGLSLYEGVTLASIVEREVGARDINGRVNNNRSQAAQVFLKRLSIGMMLQSNATDGYPAEYDTYSIPGLPPSPIGSVTTSSLSAVAQPSDTNYLYFVSGTDCITRFSESEAQHEQLKSIHGIAKPEDNCRG